jgi:integrase
MKVGGTHRVPLSGPALDLLRALPTGANNNFVFIGQTQGKPVGGSMVLLRVLRKLGHSETAHGFRSTFSDWAHELPGTAPLEIEQSLAHSSGKVALSYRRGDLLAKRRRLLDAWARYCTSPAMATADVVDFNTGRR